jgi:intracellular multiplication protein IcmN
MQLWRKNYISMLMVALMLCMMNSCQNHRARYSLIDSDPRLPHQVAGSSDSLMLAFEKRFKKQNVRVVVMGDDYLISVPTGSLFADQSPRITWGSYALLNDIACYLRLYRKVSVQVSAYVSQYGSTRREHALALARSNAIANYLWSQDVESRFIFSHGQGSEKPIVFKSPQNDRAPNARIEITFRRVEA